MAKVNKNENLQKHTTFRIGGPAGLYFIPETPDELAACIKERPEAFILGGGSNLLVSDRGLPEVIALKEIKGFEATMNRLNRRKLVKVGAGYSFTALSRKVRSLALSGLEFAFGIPGTVGGAVVMNAGASGGEVKDKLVSAEVLHAGAIKEMKAAELGLSYRKSELPKGAVVVSATFELEEGDEAEIGRKMKKNLEDRKKSQPLEFHSAGSIFKNPEGDFAGKIIEESNLKGASVGDAVVSEKHANFIVNLGKATASQVLELIEKIEKEVLGKKGIKLEREIKLAGRF